MSLSQAFSSYPNTQLRLGYYLLAAMVSGLLAMPTGMLMSRLLPNKTPPTELAPTATQPLRTAPSLSPPEADVTSAIAPSPALPRESAPAESALTPATPMAMAPSEAAPPVIAPSAVLPPPAAVRPSQALDIPGIAVAPSASGNLQIGRPQGKPADRAQAAAHAAVLAVLKSLGSHGSGTPHARRAGKPDPAAGHGGRNIHAPQPLPGASPVPSAASALDRRGAGPGVLGGPATSLASNAGLNGTGMRHRL
jgi:hypothetical protein